MNHKVIFLFLCVLLLECKTERPSQNVNNTILFKDEVPQDFLGFYDRFHSDKEYQLEHIIFPLKEQSDSSSWLKDNWKMHKPFDTQNGEFSRSYKHLNGIVVEHISDKKGLFQIQRRFSKSGDTYNLIYYKITNAFEHSNFVEEQ